MPFKFIWDNKPNIELFSILGLGGDSNIVYSCFNYEPGPASTLTPPNLLKIFYTGERFLDDVHADVIVGFLPHEPRDFRILEYPVEVINVLNGYTNQCSAIIPLNKIIFTGRTFIVLRDQERDMLESLYMAGKWMPGSPINIYRDLNISWSKMITSYKPRFCCFIVSNPMCWQRNNFYEMLNQYKPVDSLGNYKRKLPIDIHVIPDRSSPEYSALISQYKFMITFENTSLAYYNTEKILNALKVGTIPIYWGDPLIDAVYNPDCFVWVKTCSAMKEQYTEFKSKIELIKQIDSDPEIYAGYFKNALMLDAEAEDVRLESSISSLLKFVSSPKNPA